MAYTSIHTIRATVSAAIAYITNGDKTIDGLYVNSYACRSDSAGASEDFRAVRGTGTGRTQILAYHMIQSFAPGEVTPEQAMQIGEELCDRYLKGDYQYVIAVHNTTCIAISFLTIPIFTMGLVSPPSIIKAGRTKERGQSCVKYRTRYVLNTAYRSSTRLVRAYLIMRTK